MKLPVWSLVTRGAPGAGFLSSKKITTESAEKSWSVTDSSASGEPASVEPLRLSRLKAGRFLVACQFFLVPAREARLLLDVDKTFGQTRSGTGNTHTLGQGLPRIRALDGCLYCCPQARLRTLPEVLGNRGNKGLEMQMCRQKG